MNAVLTKPLEKDKAEDILTAFIPYRKATQKTEPQAVAQQQETDPYLIQGEALDFELAKKQLGGEDIAKEMLGIMLTNLPEELKKIQAAYNQKDWETVRSLAHKVKGSAAYCGTMRLKEACSSMDYSVRAGKTELYEGLYKNMLTEIAVAEKAIKEKTG